MSIITESNNQQPLAPTINGPTSGKTGIKYDFTFVTIDPNEDDIYYYIDWGDGNFEDWDGPFKSGYQLTASHTWSTHNIFTIKVKAKDIYGAEGPWGVLKVNIPRSKNAFNYEFRNLFVRFTVLLPLLKILLQRLV